MSETLTNNQEVQTENTNIGDIRIADEVVAIIAGLAATEVDGVCSMVGGITKSLVSRLGMKNLSKGVKVEINDKEVEVKLALNVNYNTHIPEISKKVQDKVKSAIEGMTGLSVVKVDVSIAGVNV